MKKTLLTFCAALLLGTAWPAIGEQEGLGFRCGMHLGGKGMTYQPSLGWEKSDLSRRARSVLMTDAPGDMTLPRTSEKFQLLRGDTRIAKPLALAKAGCTWR